MKHTSLLILSFASLTLAGCGTFNGLQKDFVNMKNKLGETKEVWSAKNENRQQVAQQAEVGEYQGDVIPVNEVCPPVNIAPVLASMTEFKNMESPSPSTEISNISLESADATCYIEGEFLNMRVDLNFKSTLGPKARIKADDRPFFAYPYFIAVNDGVGNELAKEIFAASISFDADQDSILLVETIRQRLPLDVTGVVPDYNVSIGFQLTEDQLFYNTSRFNN